MSAISASAKPSADTDTELYECPTSQKAIVSVNACNTGSTKSEIRIFVNDGNDRYLEYGFPLQPQGSVGNTMERTSIVMIASSTINVRADTANVDFYMSGVEEVA